MGKQQNTFEKRRREHEKRQKAEEKRKKRRDRKENAGREPEPDATPDESAEVADVADE